jgi:hypothetical protein
MFIDTLNASVEDYDNDFSPLNKILGFAEIPDDSNEPFIQKLVKQQEELNRFKDICNPGIAYGFYQYW